MVAMGAGGTMNCAWSCLESRTSSPRSSPRPRPTRRMRPAPTSLPDSTTRYAQVTPDCTNTPRPAWGRVRFISVYIYLSVYNNYIYRYVYIHIYIFHDPLRPKPCRAARTHRGRHGAGYVLYLCISICLCIIIIYIDTSIYIYTYSTTRYVRAMPGCTNTPRPASGKVRIIYMSICLCITSYIYIPRAATPKPRRAARTHCNRTRFLLSIYPSVDRSIYLLSISIYRCM